MDENALALDGNALAGLLSEVFAHEMTTVRCACASCGGLEQVGGERVYMRAPGAVVRCRHCDDVLMVVVRRDGRYLLGFRALKWLEIREEE